MQLDLTIDETDVPTDAPRVAQEQLATERGERPRARAHGAHGHLSARELEEVETAERGGVLVLPSAADPEILTLDAVR